MEVEKLLAGAFRLIGCAILMALLYAFFFGSGDWEGALFYASRQMEYPIAKYYYTYCYLPEVHMEDGTDKALGGTVSDELNSTSSVLTDDDETNSVFDGTVTFSAGGTGSFYTSGWQ